MSTNRFASSASLMYFGKKLKILNTVSPGDLISFLNTREKKKRSEFSTQFPTPLYVFLYKKDMFLDNIKWNQ
jgi:hypothetical protein